MASLELWIPCIVWPAPVTSEASEVDASSGRPPEGRTTATPHRQSRDTGDRHRCPCLPPGRRRAPSLSDKTRLSHRHHVRFSEYWSVGTAQSFSQDTSSAETVLNSEPGEQTSRGSRRTSLSPSCRCTASAQKHLAAVLHRANSPFCPDSGRVPE
jgi:hypothetical protein